MLEKKWAKTVKNRQNYEGKISEYPVNMVAQASKYERSFRNLFQSLNEKNILNFFWKIAMQPSGAGHKVCSQDNWHEQSKGENEVK